MEKIKGIGRENNYEIIEENEYFIIRTVVKSVCYLGNEYHTFQFKDKILEKKVQENRRPKF